MDKLFHLLQKITKKRTPNKKIPKKKKNLR